MIPSREIESSKKRNNEKERNKQRKISSKEKRKQVKNTTYSNQRDKKFFPCYFI